MARSKGMAGAVFALSIFIMGGISTFTGLALIGLMKNQDLFGWGEGRSIGILLLCIGLISSILGVFIMRLVRNRY